jgi:hypothetical protein
MSWEQAGGASSARWKLAGSLMQYGIFVQSSHWGPPTDDDFIKAILDAVRSGRLK